MDEVDLAALPAPDPGDAFQERCWNVLRRHHRPQDLVEIPAQMGGDYGIEGYTTDGIAYQCYADRDSPSLLERTRKQKAKLSRDLRKLRSNAADIERVLGGTVLTSYFLVVPSYHSADLVGYANERAADVRSWNLPFIGADFTVRLKRLEDYPDALRAALHDGSVQALVPIPIVDDLSVATFHSQRPELVATVDAKLEALRAIATADELTQLRDDYIRAFLEKEQVLDALKDWPAIGEGVEECRVRRERALAFDNVLNSDAPDQRIRSLQREYAGDLEASVGGLRQGDAELIARGQTGDWLMRCPLRFRSQP